MKKTSTIKAFAIFTIALITAACGGDPGSKVIKSTKAGDLTVTLMSASGDLRNGENELVLSFTDASGNPVDAGAASLNFHMPAMGTMAEMNGRATLTTTESPGRYRAQVDIEMKGTWEAQIKYEGPRGSGQANMSVTAK